MEVDHPFAGEQLGLQLISVSGWEIVERARRVDQIAKMLKGGIIASFTLLLLFSIPSNLIEDSVT